MVEILLLIFACCCISAWFGLCNSLMIDDATDGFCMTNFKIISCSRILFSVIVFVVLVVLVQPYVESFSLLLVWFLFLHSSQQSSSINHTADHLIFFVWNHLLLLLIDKVLLCCDNLHKCQFTYSLSSMHVAKAGMHPEHFAWWASHRVIMHNPCRIDMAIFQMQ